MRRASFVGKTTGGLKIILDPPYERNNFKSQLFIPGDRVAGKVVLNLKTDEKVEGIYIELKGALKIQSGLGQDSRSYEFEMFAEQKTLFQGPFKLRASTYEYSFSFQFPEMFEHDQKKYTEDGFFPGQAKRGPHRLPPTCEEQDIRTGMCSVIYTLVVKIPKTMGNWEDKLFLYFTPRRTQRRPAAAPRPLKDLSTLQRQFRLTGEGIPRPLTKREAMKEAFRHQNETRTVQFSLSVLVPTAIIIGQPYEIEVTVVSDSSMAGNSMPGFQMKDYSVSLRSRTDVRAPNATWETLGFLESMIPLSSGKLDLNLAFNTPTKVNEMFPLNHYYAPPSFTTWAIRRTYGLELKTTISCLGEDFKCKVLCHNVTLYSARMAEGAREATESTGVGNANLGDVDQEELPGYVERPQMGRIGEEPPPLYETVTRESA